MFQTGKGSVEHRYEVPAFRPASKRTPAHSLIGSVVLSCLVLGLAGCASLQQGNDAASTTAPKPATLPATMPSTATSQTLADGSIRHDINSARIAQLWAASEKARSADDLELADRRLTEALTIAPEDPILWSRAAEIKLSLLEPALAENYAAKSNVYALSNRTLQHRNWLIIEHAREMRGDLLGVRDAHKMVQQLQY